MKIINFIVSPLSGFGCTHIYRVSWDLRNNAIVPLNLNKSRKNPFNVHPKFRDRKEYNIKDTVGMIEWH